LTDPRFTYTGEPGILVTRGCTDSRPAPSILCWRQRVSSEIATSGRSQACGNAMVPGRAGRHDCYQSLPGWLSPCQSPHSQWYDPV